MRLFTLRFLLLWHMGACLAMAGVSGRVLDPQGKPIPGAVVRLDAGSRFKAATQTDGLGHYEFLTAAPGEYTLTAESPGLTKVSRAISFSGGGTEFDLRFTGVAAKRESIVIEAKTMEPGIDLRNAETFNRTLFTRDDQALQQLNAGIDAGQHEGGGKSLEIRRFGFNLDHGGVNGGLKVLVDDIQQNQGTQGHGQGYLGALKALSPELIQEVNLINGPFSAEYGDFSGLGVVHIRQRESLPEDFTARVQGGNFDTRRAFLAYSPNVERADAYVAYDGSSTNGPFQNPGRYRRDNVNGNYTRSLGENERLGFRVLYGRNQFYSSGQVPTDLVNQGLLDRYGYVDPSDGGRVNLGTAAAYFSKTLANGDTFKTDGSVGRSLFDLYSNFTFYLHDPVHGDAFQQHDSRLQEGWNAQYTHNSVFGGVPGVLTAGANFYDAQINVGLYPREGRNPTGVTTRARARITNAAGYAQENLSLLRGRLIMGGGLRYDGFFFDVRDEVTPEASGGRFAGRWQGKGSAALTPVKSVPLTLHVNYGRGINSSDARSVVQMPEQPRVATTDFYQAGVALRLGRFSWAADAFRIDHSNEQVYIPDDGSIEFKGPSRAYGYEAKTSVALTTRVSLNAGVTKISNAYYRGGDHRVYVDSAPHFVGNAALTVTDWRGWSGSLRARAINHYRLDGDDPSIVASGHTVLDLGVAKQIRRGVELNVSVDNLTNQDYWETQNYFESRVTPTALVVARIHATPAYPLTAVVGVTLRLGERNHANKNKIGPRINTNEHE